MKKELKNEDQTLQQDTQGLVELTDEEASEVGGGKKKKGRKKNWCSSDKVKAWKAWWSKQSSSSYDSNCWG